MNGSTLFTIFLTAVILAIPFAILIIRDRIWPPKPIRTESDWAAQQRRYMKLWVVAGVILLGGHWVIRHWIGIR